MEENREIESPELEVDIACVGFGPAQAGFLYKLSSLLDKEGSKPLNIVCFERSSVVGSGVSGVVTKAEAIQGTLGLQKLLKVNGITKVEEEKLLYLFDYLKVSKRSFLLKAVDYFLEQLERLKKDKSKSFKIPFIPSFFSKKDGYAFSISSFLSFIAEDISCNSNIQIWPEMPVEKLIFKDGKVTGIKLIDQGVNSDGTKSENFTKGFNVKAKLVVLADGATGCVGKSFNSKFNIGTSNDRGSWAAGMKLQVELSPDSCLKKGTVIHTLGFPEPEIFGFIYALENNMASIGLLVSSSFESPIKTTYRYLQHWILHPAVYKYLKKAKLKSWGAKSLCEMGLNQSASYLEDHVAKIGEGSGTNDILTGSGVDEAWLSGVLLAEGVFDIIREGKDFTKDELTRAYYDKRRDSQLNKKLQKGINSRNGFCKGFILGMLGMGISGLTNGLLYIPRLKNWSLNKVKDIETYFSYKFNKKELKDLEDIFNNPDNNQDFKDVVMNKLGWPEIKYDGSLLMSHQDAMLLGGKVESRKGYKNHVLFNSNDLCRNCRERVCVSLCSGQAITYKDNKIYFDKEKCVYCGVCSWSCSKKDNNIEYQTAAGGLQSLEN